jgi:signal transduction histidine kinase
MPSNKISGQASNKSKVQLLYAMTAIGITILISFASRAFLAQEKKSAIIELAIAVLTLANIAFYRTSKNVAWASRILQLLLVAVLLCVSLLETGLQNGIVVWYYVFPILTIYLSGIFEGMIWSAVGLIFVVCLMMYHNNPAAPAGYTDIFIARYMLVYIVITFMTFSFEKMRRKAQFSLYLSEKELLKKNTDLRMLLSSISDIIFSIDNNGTLIKIFQPYDQSAAINLPDEFIGNTYSKVLPEQICKGLDLSISQLKNDGGSSDFSYTIGDDLQKNWFLAKVSVMKDEHGAVTGYTVIARNITEQKQEELKRKALEEDLLRVEQKAVIGRIAAGVAHEINNPASAVTSDLATMSQLVIKLSESNVKDLLVEIIKRDRLAIARVTNIVSAVKGAYRPQKWHSIDIKNEIELQLTLLHKECKDRITIQRDFGRISSVDVYGSEIGQIILNLLRNAIDAIEDKGLITIKTAEEGDNVKISITDTGKGIPANILPHIFEPFYTSKDVGKGTGLGLSISITNATRHNGKLYVEKTEPGKGSTLVLVFPKKRNSHEKV